MKKVDENNLHGTRPSPMIVYIETPKIIHVEADEFKAVVQRLTGQNQALVDLPSSSSLASFTGQNQAPIYEPSSSSLAYFTGQNQAPTYEPSSSSLATFTGQNQAPVDVPSSSSLALRVRDDAGNEVITSGDFRETTCMKTTCPMGCSSFCIHAYSDCEGLEGTFSYD